MITKYEAIIFDLAGTIIDHGSFAPVAAFVDLFHSEGVNVSAELVRSFMGLGKREHLTALLEHSTVKSKRDNAEFNANLPAKVEQLYQRFLGFQIEASKERCIPIKGALETIEQLRSKGIAIGMTTGYPDEIVDAIRPEMKALGFPTEVIVTASQVAVGRPAPWMIYRAAEALGVYPMEKVVVVDDTQAGVQAGMNAGCRTIGVSRTGNLLGLSEMELRCTGDRREPILAEASKQLKEAGADLVLESVADLNDLIESEV